MKNNLFTIGDIVKVKESFLEEPENILAYVYEEYKIGDITGVSIITENGVDMGGFSKAEQEDFLEYVDTSKYKYEFKNALHLDRDFETLIKPLFNGN